MRFSKLFVFGVALMFLISACKTEKAGQEEKIVEFGSTVVFDYAAGFDNGTLFDTSFETAAREAGIYDPSRIYDPEKVVIGEDPLIPGLLGALIGMKKGDVKNIRIPPEEAYGIKIENSTNILSKDFFSNPDSLEVGQIVIIATPEGDGIPVFVAEINEDNVTIDQNHPLAGEFIQFSVIVRNIE